MPVAAAGVSPEGDRAVTGAEFAALMARFAPFDGRRVAVAVSGGADSMALLLLTRHWGDPLALVVDHGLRPESAVEAALTIRRLDALGVPARLLPLHLPGGSDLGARARAARYAALLAACAAAGRADLLLGHHARDQAETIQLRTSSGSGPAGRAGMAEVAWRGTARLLRPLLGIGPARLRATLRTHGVGWVEDPGNQDPATARGALRQSPQPPQPTLGPARALAEAALAQELAAQVTLHEAGHARVAGELSTDAWSALLWTLSGRPYPPGRDQVAALRCRGVGTLHGLQLSGGWVTREAAAVAAPVPAVAGAGWDGRFHLRDGVEGAELGALGAASAGLRRHRPWPARALRVLPALWRDGKVLAVPHLRYPDAESCRSLRIEFRPARPLAGAPFAT